MKIATLLTLMVLLVACGQKGALYLPQPSAQQSKTPTQSPSAQHTEPAVSDDPNDF